MTRSTALVACAALLSACSVLRVEAPDQEDAFESDWFELADRVWIGERYWANRLQDWRLVDGGVECVEARPRFGVRTLHLLTHRIDPGQEGSFRATVRVAAGPGDRGGSAAGFLVGAGGTDVNPLLSAQVHGAPAEDGGFLALVDGDGRATFCDFEQPVGDAGGPWTLRTNHELDAFVRPVGVAREGDGFGETDPRDVDLELVGARFDGRHTLTLVVRDAADRTVLSTAVWDDAPESAFDGAVALVSHRGPRLSDEPTAARGYRFRDWRMSGELVVVDDSRRFGPIAFVHYTVDETRGPRDALLRLTAQSFPLGTTDTLVASLDLETEKGRFREVATAPFVPGSATFHFSVQGIDATRTTPFRVRYVPRSPDGEPDPSASQSYSGVIAPRPDDDAMTIAVLNCQKSFTGDLRWNESGLWFPHADVAQHAFEHDPDLLYFAGDQIYEGDLTPAIRRPLDVAILDYLYKWYRHGLSFGELTRRLPSVVVPDDHDVYHGNIWGNGGVRLDAPEGTSAQDRGGYVMPVGFVNAVHRTQTAHLPPPFDPTPLPGGITRYQTLLSWGGGSFAILGDRMDKSPPTVLVPEGDVRNGWAQNPDFDPLMQADVPGAVLLGPSQTAMLRAWGGDWADDTWFKACLSQTPFANVATLPAGSNSGSVIPTLEVPEPGVYVVGDERAADMDSNGWPRSGRDEAVRLLRAAGAFHLAGDQHLGSTLRYGVTEFDDAGYVLSSPAVANTWPRRWFPDPADRQEGGDVDQDAGGYTGRYFDGFGNRMTVHAVANPRSNGVEPRRLHERAPGYGIVRVERGEGTVRFEAWPRHVDPSAPGARPYAGWPVVASLQDADGRRPVGWLPELDVEGPVVVRVQRDGVPAEVIYTRRFEQGPVRLPVFDADTSYTIRVDRPGRAAIDPWPWERSGQRPSADGGTGSLSVRLPAFGGAARGE
ncbi:MAG: hypothetical protein AAF726_04075 [Planctomycetota bacterium]